MKIDFCTGLRTGILFLLLSACASPQHAKVKDGKKPAAQQVQQTPQHKKRAPEPVEQAAPPAPKVQGGSIEPD